MTLLVLAFHVYQGQFLVLFFSELVEFLSSSATVCKTVGWFKMKLGVQVGLGHGLVVLDEDRVPLPPKAHSPPNFRPMSVVAKW